jgi:hypothetical protein
MTIKWRHFSVKGYNIIQIEKNPVFYDWVLEQDRVIS